MDYGRERSSRTNWEKIFDDPRLEEVELFIRTVPSASEVRGSDKPRSA
jgi:hypothetical protein